MACVVISACVGFLHHHSPQSFGSPPLSFRSCVLWSVCKGKGPRVNTEHSGGRVLGTAMDTGMGGSYTYRYSGHRGGRISQLVKTPICANKRQSEGCILP